jgi:hypothetical protein
MVPLQFGSSITPEGDQIEALMDLVQVDETSGLHDIRIWVGRSETAHARTDRPPHRSLIVSALSTASMGLQTSGASRRNDVCRAVRVPLCEPNSSGSRILLMCFRDRFSETAPASKQFAARVVAHLSTAHGNLSKNR